MDALSIGFMLLYMTGKTSVGVSNLVTYGFISTTADGRSPILTPVILVFLYILSNTMEPTTMPCAPAT